MRLQLAYLRLNLGVILAMSFVFATLCMPATSNAQTNKALPAIISLLLDSDRCITPIKVGEVVFDTLDPTCPSEGRTAGTFAAYYSFTHPGGPLHIDLLSDFPNSYDAFLFLRKGEARNGSLVIGDDDGHEDYRSSRIIESSLLAGRYTIEATAFVAGVAGSLSVSVYANRVTAKATGKLNDTGIKYSANETFLDNSSVDPAVDQCVASTEGGDNQFAAQDCSFGRDADDLVGDGLSRADSGTTSDYNDGDGASGFSFLKVSASGAPLPANALAWSCVKDNVTGLMWEVKTDDSGLHDKDDTFTWFNTNTGLNGGADGDPGQNNTCFGYVAGVPATYCNTQAYVERVNVAPGNLCGTSDWRLPAVPELRSIVNYNTHDPSIDTTFFPNTPNSVFWSASPQAIFTDEAWGVGFGYGSDEIDLRTVSAQVRLVRGGQ